MRLKSPSSCGSLRVRFSLFDVFWAAVTPLLALALRDAYILSAKGAETAFLYCSLSFAGALFAFLVFRVGNGVSRYFSVEDALNVLKAGALAGAATILIVFTFNRLDGIPRSTPLLQVLILAAGLLTARMVMLFLHDDGQVAKLPGQAPVEHIIVIGSTRLSSLYIRFLRACSVDHYRFIAILDEANRFIGRTICGVPVVGLPAQLDPVIEEFAVHGVRTDRVIVGGDESLLGAQLLADIRRVCERRHVDLDFVPQLVELRHLQPANNGGAPPRSEPLFEPVALPAYWRAKRAIDFSVAFLAIVVFSPLLLIATLLVLIDLGSPVLFWQQRMGQHGRTFLLHKFRTLRAPFDHNGQPVADDRRISAIGRLLRMTRIDELPQLFSVLVGEMSLIGPRPLLPRDQPANASLRLSVRPGITGWAQINGGTLITREEKGALDEWYIRHASAWLDLRIALLTLHFVFTGERRSEAALRDAKLIQHASRRPRRLAYADVREIKPENQPATMPRAEPRKSWSRAN